MDFHWPEPERRVFKVMIHDLWSVAIEGMISV
jgi:hypothetical protein